MWFLKSREESPSLERNCKTSFLGKEPLGPDLGGTLKAGSMCPSEKMGQTWQLRRVHPAELHGYSLIWSLEGRLEADREDPTHGVPSVAGN